MSKNYKWYYLTSGKISEWLLWKKLLVTIIEAYFGLLFFSLIFNGLHSLVLRIVLILILLVLIVVTIVYLIRLVSWKNRNKHQTIKRTRMTICRRF